MDFGYLGQTFVLIGTILIILFLILNNINGIIGSYFFNILGTLFVIANISHQGLSQRAIPFFLFLIIYGLTVFILIKYKDKITYHSSNFYSYFGVSFIFLILQHYFLYNYYKYLSLQIFMTLLNVITLITIATMLKYMTTDGFAIVRNL
jgi:hypothetical protein